MLRLSTGPLVLCLALLLSGCSPDDSEPAAATPPDSLKQRVTDVVTTIDMMRESLALTIDTTETVNAATFGRVCKPVGQRAKAFAQSHGWAFQQLARKNRNPAHTLDAEAEAVYETFAAHPDSTEQWVRTVRNGTDGWRYFRRITVERSCLACHGAKEQRPTFVKNGYPNDRAYNFEPGDLRGIYAVFVPTPTEASPAE